MLPTHTTTFIKPSIALALGCILYFSSFSLSIASEKPTTYENNLAKAQKGDSKSQTALGNMYHDGFGVAKNIEQAIYWYRKAADQNHPEGLHQLGHEYSQGHGVTKDHQKAFELFLSAAEQGHAKSQYRVGSYYLNQNPQDLDNAFLWLNKSANNGHDKAQYLVGQFYHQGAVVKKDIKKAFEFYTKSADQDYLDAQLQALNLMIVTEQVSTVPDTLKRYIRSAAQKNNPTAQFFLGEMYQYGKYFNKDLAVAYDWLKKAAEQEQRDAQYALGLLYLSKDIKGQNYDIVAATTKVPLDEIYFERANHWLNRASKNGHSGATTKLRQIAKK